MKEILLSSFNWSLQTFAVAAFTLGLTCGASAKPGDLDRAYGAGTGKVLFTTGYPLVNVSTSALQSDGKLLVGGYCYPNPTSRLQQMCIARVLSSGSLDSGFADGGIFRGEQASCASGIALSVLPSGYIVIAGKIWSPVNGRLQFCAIRLTPDGMVDSSFGQAGIAIVSPADSTSVANDFVDSKIDSDGRILMSSSCQNLPSTYLKFCAARLLPNGTVDSAFGNQGMQVVYGATFSDGAYGLALHGSKIYMLGECSPGGTSEFCVSRLNADGQVDASWGNNGRVQSNLGGFAVSQAYQLAFTPDGIALVVAACGNATIRRGCLVSLNANGSLTTAFGNGGVVEDASPYAQSGYTKVLLSRDAKYLVLGGRCGDSFRSNSPCVWRLLPSGAPDMSFGSNGVVKVPFPPTAMSYSTRPIHEQPDGKIIFASACLKDPSSEANMCLGRLHARQDFFDLDNDNESSPASDGVLYLRHLLGYRDTAITTGALGTYADRTVGTDIATYLSTPNATYPNCSASIVGAPGGPSAMLDGVVLLRAMFGLTGTAVTSGINFPVGTTRTTWSDIKAHLNTNCGMALN